MRIESVMFEATRRLLARNDVTTARSLLRAVPGPRKSGGLWPTASLADLAILIARNPDEMLSLGAGSRLSRASVAVLNIMPLARLEPLIAHPDLASEDRAELARVVWVRAWLLGRRDVFERATAAVRRLVPEVAADLDAVEGAWSDVEREHAVLRLLLKYPRFSPFMKGFAVGTRSLAEIDRYDHNDNNWWCSVREMDLRQRVALVFYDGTLGIPEYWTYDDWRLGYRNPAFFDRAFSLPDRDFHFVRSGLGRLSDSALRLISERREKFLRQSPLLRLADWEELRALGASPNGPKYLTLAAIRWAESTTWLDRLLGRDRDLPWVLHRAVVATRYGCTRDGGHAAYSRRAYMLLHERYSGSEWARKTRYWFDRPQPAADPNWLSPSPWLSPAWN
jgi:hypothetical protein